ncbi:hypothetical protein CYMTET_4106 [Cymbomonas tetramitiformis]|uniref:Apple domain-containing protein n=1 Tax=Cymbomonas tetramitiformis TaxID=36881 RepID=A0AAE0BHQ0_9CHLO|nr:hypothetical protein CYMTET_53770 [Cymbomonas tetramitiformis]KAK3248821.1 hypothetical protein CYMTET_41731 [Cymbomonas tetramitiformis]KAK3288422.1 hypothetical protein CYMTET_4106 [Cymbomonas tetramitiformis]
MRSGIIALLTHALLISAVFARRHLAFSDSDEAHAKVDALKQDTDRRDVGVLYEELSEESDERANDRFSEYDRDADETSESTNAWSNRDDDGYRVIGQGVCDAPSTHHVVIYEGRPSVSVDICHDECAASLVCKGFAHREGDNRCLMYHLTPSQAVDAACGRNGECFVCYKLTEDEAESDAALPERWTEDENEVTWKNLKVNLEMQQYYDLEDPLWQFARKWTRVDSFSETTPEIFLEDDRSIDPRAVDWLGIADRDRSRTVSREELAALAVATLDVVMRSTLERA